MSSCSVTKVDFKNKRVIEDIPEYKAYTWQCIHCQDKFKYDSRLDTNTRSISLQIGQKELRICPKCVKEMSDLIGE